MPSVIGLDDTDSRETGMCTTYLAATIADALREAGDVERTLLIRLNPAVEHKTRGNAALAIHCSLDAADAFAIAREAIPGAARTADDRTNPGLVVAPHAPDDAPDDVVAFAADAVREYHDRSTARAIADAHDYRTATWGNGRGLIGALAAVGAWRATADWTYEYISYRLPERRGTPRDVDAESVFAAADAYYPRVWDTVDHGEGDLVCVPHTPGPILHGIRGDDPDAVRAVADRIESEPVESAHLFRTNQGTDAHLRDASLSAVEDGYAYRVTGTVVDAPDTREGGHVFFALADEAAAPDEGTGAAATDTEPEAADDARLRCAAFEPTKRFRDRVRALRVGDRVTVCGEVAAGTCKLEKFAVRDLNTTAYRNPRCPECGRSMESAGRNQGYRCRRCDTTAAEKVAYTIDRDVDVGWYEVPPCARRHIAKPLIRGGFDAPVHPER